MLHCFLTTNRDELIRRCREKVAQRAAPEATPEELEFGIPLFLEQVIKTLAAEEADDAVESRNVSGSPGGQDSDTAEIGNSATLHGRELMKHGFTVDQVVHDYGDLCQAITSLAFEENAPIEIDEFRTLNRCLDNGIADAVTEFNRQGVLAASTKHTDALHEQLGFSRTNCATWFAARRWRWAR